MYVVRETRPDILYRAFINELMGNSYFFSYAI